MQGSFNDVKTSKNRENEDLKTKPLDPLELAIPDEELVDIIDKRINESRIFYEESYDLYSRRRKNEMYYFGRQIAQRERDRDLKSYESRFQDNVLYEIESTIKPLAMSRLPDLMVTPGNDSDESVLMAQEVSKAVDTDIKDRENRKVLGLAFKHHPVYFTGCIKVRWNPEIDDYVFECIHPDEIDIDHTCPTNDANEMQFVSQLVPLTVEEVVMRFPNKKEEFFKELQRSGLMVGDTPGWKLMATTIKIRETWFHQFKRHSDTQWERIDGVMWKYKKCLLHKMKNPNFDYEGEIRYFSYDEKGVRQGVTENDLQHLLITGQVPENIKEEKVYHNYFRTPEKPYYFLGYDQWGRQPMDETSRIEQNIRNQETLDKRGKQIDETLDNRGHNVFSKEAGLTSADVESIDMNDPDEDFVVDGNVNNTHKYIEPQRPTPAEFEEVNNLRNRMYSIAGSQSVRGQIMGNAPATNNQIARENDFTRADDLVEDTINAAAEWMARWSLQFIKLRYTKDHFKEILGIAGETVWMKLNRNMVDEGMVVKIKASGTDKLRAQNNAMDMAKMEMIDPYTFFTDMGLSDPEGRTEKLMLMKTDPMAYMQKVIKGLDTSTAMAQALMNQTALEQQQMASQQMQQPNPLVAQGQPATGPTQPQNPTVTNTAQIPATPPTGLPPQGVL